MWILVSAVFTASLMGSLHCVGMCGPLALWASGADQRASSSRLFLSTALYHFGRLLTYSLVGLLAGSIGQALDWGGNTFGIQLLAARVVGLAMILVGLVGTFRIARPWLLARLSTLRSNQSEANGRALAEDLPGQGTYIAPTPNWITRQLIRLRPRLFGLPLSVRAASVGLLTALLPCGWLYLFALLAAGTGSAFSGAVLMAAFWLGSVPALVSLIAGSRLLSAPFRRAVPLAASLLLIVAGGYTAVGRGMAELKGKLKVSSSLVDQLQSGQSLDSLKASDVQSGLEQLVATPLPCCQARMEGGSDSDGISPAASHGEVSP